MRDTPREGSPVVAEDGFRQSALGKRYTVQVESRRMRLPRRPSSPASSRASIRNVSDCPKAPKHSSEVQLHGRISEAIENHPQSTATPPTEHPAGLQPVGSGPMISN